MVRILTSIRCPSCQGPLQPVRMTCGACGIAVDGNFAQNEFASLSAEDLHLLRIFVRTEGSIREMEAALGVSYPTVKSKLFDLKDRLGLAPTPTKPPDAATTNRSGEADKGPREPESDAAANARSRATRLQSQPPADVGRRVREVLDQLHCGDLSPGKAADAIRKLGK